MRPLLLGVLDAGAGHHRGVHGGAFRLRRSAHPRAGVRLEPHRQRHRLLDPLLRRSLSRSGALDAGVGRARTWDRRFCSASRRRWWVTWCSRAVPFPGLEQIAVFCMTGLVVGCGCVLCLYPVLARRARQTAEARVRASAQAIDRVSCRAGAGRRREAGRARGAASLVVALGLARAAHPGRRQGAAAVAAATRRAKSSACASCSAAASRRASSSCRAIRRRRCSSPKSGSRRRSTGLMRNGAIASYQAVSTGVPSLARQRRNHELLARARLRAGRAARSGDEHARLRAAGHRTAPRGIRSRAVRRSPSTNGCAVRRRRARGICGWARSDRVTPRGDARRHHRCAGADAALQLPGVRLDRSRRADHRTS